MLIVYICRHSPPSLLYQIQASPPPAPEAQNGISSPLLQALAGIPTLEPSNPSGYSTTQWAKNIPFGRSPPDTRSNGPSLDGSPPDPVQHHDEVRGGFNHFSPPNSPSATFRQPVRRNNGYQSFGDHLGSSPGRGRPVSMHSQYPQAPPLPHQTQAHFYGAPDIDFGPHQPHSDSASLGSNFCCIFDSLASSGDEGPNINENVLLVGSEYKLDVFSVNKKNLERVHRLEGLRGSVIGAKILPSTLRVDPHRSLRPLVAVIIHGLQNTSEPDHASRPGTSHSEDPGFDPSGSMLQALHSADVGHQKATLCFQTTVEIYSLRKGLHVATLFKSPKVEVDSPRDAQEFVGPSPVGNLSVQAKGKFIVVSSGTSGEIFIFDSQAGSLDDSPVLFKCLGKVWTRVLHRKTRSHSISSNSSDAENMHGMTSTKLHTPDAATFSLSHRWLAIVPPPPSTQATLHGTIDALRAQKIPGLSSHTSPTEPQPTCDVETPEGESVLSKMARDVTQEFIKGARWVGDQGVQAWNNYWAKPPEKKPNLTHHSTKARWESNSQQVFPPTHANDDNSNRPSSQPALVSILDLEKLSAAHNMKPASAIQPIATFSLPYGCSLVSFSPSGLSLLTASAKGDVQNIWDLLRMIHGEAGSSPSKAHGPSERRPIVREIAHFTRMTVAKIADVVWTEPRGERFAIVTERGTVHIFDLPHFAFRWPPPRQVMRSTSMPASSGNTEHDLDKAVPPSGNTLSAAMDLVAGKTQPLLAAVRGRPPNIGGAFAGLGGLAFPTSAGAKGSKAVAAGFTKSVDAATGTVNTLRHLGENRLALPGSSHPALPGCVRWLTGKDQGLLAVTGRGTIRIHSIRQSNHHRAAKRRPSVLGGKPIEFNLSSVSNSPDKEGLSNKLAATEQVNIFSRSPRGHLLSHTSGTVSKSSRSITHPLSYAEIETNAPYQPFHTDRRINFYVFKQDDSSSDIHHLNESTPWAFGEPIPVMKVSVGSSTAVEDETDLFQQTSQVPLENFISVEENDDVGQQVVVTTRRKRGARRGTADHDRQDEEEFFEDDCEVVDFAEERV